MRVDRRLRLEKAILWNDIGEIEVCLIKSPDCSNIFTVTVENKCAYASVLDLLWNDMFAEVGQIILQTFDQHLPIEDVDSHRRLK